MLSDRTIRKLCEKGELKIISRDLAIEDSQLQPASFDLRAGEDIAIPSQAFMLGHTMEYVHIPPMLVGRVDGKSSWARRGLSVHFAGFIDPGFQGQITLEYFNMSREPIVIEKGKRVCQISFDWMDDRPDRVYGDEGLRSRYQGQEGPTPAREWPTALGVVGCPTCRSILNAEAAGGCPDSWHAANHLYGPDPVVTAAVTAHADDMTARGWTWAP